MFKILVYGVIAILAICYLSEWLLSLGDSPNEPPRANSRIPIIGHAIGMYQHGCLYLTRLGQVVLLHTLRLLIDNRTKVPTNKPTSIL